ncbi:fused MFS/spermidine synthase [Denitrobaculum tricleocarpae]|uniref:Spermidine synthase n=1 Tax=Denitrobaculum tricleocarpae TaxID=2591009 RepID=A0A545TGF1_9PROT|nr:fused MFS/spermidine synthase [Denitrobaculum tricleocarpae]TQV76307.1 hypothetical protein FKG95_22005 [Denitrobaculum tricleocarpae]
MSSYQIAQPADAAISSRAMKGALPLFALSLFMSALLLFSVQPMFAKMVLPSLGGAPGVWNTSMVFFQTVLLAGYAYAHFSVKLLGVRRQALLHLLVLSLAFIFLPISTAADAKPWVGQPELWLLWTLTSSLGLPFLAVAATAPLLQKWFSETGHVHAKDPYFLYGASNVGSLMALLGYPIFVEPFLALGEQSFTWMLGYGLLALLILACVFVARRGDGALPETSSVPSGAAPQTLAYPGWPQRLHWIVLALVPSSLLLGVTTHISTDVAAVPLLWVVPLALYLLTFVIVFSRKPLLRQEWMVRLQPLVLIPLLASFIWSFSVSIAAAVHLVAFFVTTMVCHGELARRRPDVAHLTEFYLWMSFGGMIGGFFAALIAPVVFNSVIEYPLMIVIACWLRPSQQDGGELSHVRRRKLLTDASLPILLFAAMALAFPYLGVGPSDLGMVGSFIVFVFFALVVYGFAERPLRYALGAAAVFLAITTIDQPTRMIDQERNFFGISRIAQSDDGQFNLLIHGTTLHGAQHVDPLKWEEPLTYYQRSGPIGEVFVGLTAAGRSPSKVGVIGLGVGTLACYREPGQNWTFFEIDPAMERIARDPNYFRYLSSCAENASVVIGDARLSLQSEAGGKYDLIVLDAFSSDAIPVHLLNREALALYEAKLAPGGIIAFHISNRTLNLAPIVSRLAENAGLSGRSKFSGMVNRATYKTGSSWIVLARSDADLAFLDVQVDDSGSKDENYVAWQDVSALPKGRLWTDDFSDILGALSWD